MCREHAGSVHVVGGHSGDRRETSESVPTPLPRSGGHVREVEFIAKIRGWTWPHTYYIE
jgi:hypothetical protein